MGCEWDMLVRMSQLPQYFSSTSSEKHRYIISFPLLLLLLLLLLFLLLLLLLLLHLRHIIHLCKVSFLAGREREVLNGRGVSSVHPQTEDTHV